MADRILLESGAPDGFLLEDDSGVLLLEGDNSYENEVFADLPVFVASMEEASGSLTDLIRGKVGTAFGSPTYGTTGPISGKTAIDFGAAADYFSFSDHADLDLADGPFTIELWFRRDVDTAAEGTLVGKGTNGYYVAIRGQDTEKFVLDKGGLTGFLSGESGSTPPDGTWHHFAITRNGPTSGSTLFYKDGVLDNNVNSQDIALADTAVAMTIGSDTGSLASGGALAYVAFYKSVLSGTRIAAHYAATVIAGADEPVPYVGAGYYG